MRAPWRLATSSVFERPSRSILLVLTVALSAALVSAVSFAMASLTQALQGRAAATLGEADVRIKPSGSGRTLDAALLEKVRAWPEVASAHGKLQAAMNLQFLRPRWSAEGPQASARFARRPELLAATAMASGIDVDAAALPFTLVDGRAPSAPDEIVLESPLADRLSEKPPETLASFKGFSAAAPEAGSEKLIESKGPALATDATNAADLNARFNLKVGDTVQVRRLLRKAVNLKVVGLAAQPPLGGRFQCFMTRKGLEQLENLEGRLTEIDIILRPGVDPQATADSRRADISDSLIIQTTEKITSGIDRNIASSQLGLVLATVMAFLAASFIITTGLTTSVTEKQRELGVLRCIGASRSQLAASQLLVGAGIGLAGALIGIPLGAVAAFALVTVFKEQIPAGFAVSRLGLILAPAGALFAGLIGAAIPAWQASRVSPLRAMSMRASPPRPALVWILLFVGLALLGWQVAVLTIPSDAQVSFWLYATTGLPGMFLGYFLLGVPVTLVIVTLFGSPVARLLALPPALLTRAVRATPFRHGFTAGAMMSGLAIMVAIWTHGSSILRDWLGKLDFPDAFVMGLNLTPDSQRILEEFPFVTDTCAITLHPVETDAFGVRALQKFSNMFIAFEPGPFLDMTRLTWIEGDEATARKRLDEGGAIIVAREFKVARGLGVGDTFTCRSGDKEFTFDIVGVITSPGIDIVSKFFAIGDQYTEQSLHAVFGSRKDLREKFKSDSINLIQVGLKQEGQPGYIPDAQAVETMKRALFSAGILDAGSGRQVKQDIAAIVKGSLLVSSTIAIFSMLVAGFGVANLIIAGIHARQFEFGVLRAVGARRGQIARLVLGEATVISLAAMALGTCMGFQGAFAGRRLDKALLGLEFGFEPPYTAIAIGWAIVLVMTIGAALPAVIALTRRLPRDLLAAMKG